MSDFSTEAFMRLPKWAQAFIEKQRVDLEYYRDKLREVIGEAGNTNVLLPNYTGIMKDQSLPNNTSVRFMISNPRRLNDPGYIEIRHEEDGGLNIHGSHSVQIEPGSSNVVTLRLRIFRG